MRIAFFGGSFDPPHNGHLAIARAAQQALALDTVLFAPVALQPLKLSGSSSSFEDRSAMTRLAIAHEPHFELSLADAPGAPGAPAPNYTAETLTRLRQTLPPATQLYLLLGADSLHTFPHWHRAAEIPFLADLIIASRPNHDLTGLAAKLPSGITIHPSPGQPNHYTLSNAHNQRAHLTLLPDLDHKISATELRRQIQGSSSTQPPPIPAAVLQYIRAHRLYE
jgi:nicotinate-nucleotide adenylyltransferase